MLTKARDEPEKGMIQKVFHAYKEDTMRNKKNRVISRAMSAAIMLTNLFSPMSAYAQEEEGAQAESAVEEDSQLETETKKYMLTLPFYKDISYMGCEKSDLHTYINRFGISPKYGLSGAEIEKVAYYIQEGIQSVHNESTEKSKGGIGSL